MSLAVHAILPVETDIRLALCHAVSGAEVHGMSAENPEELVRAIRAALGVTFTGLGEIAGASARSVSRWSREGRQPHPPAARRIVVRLAEQHRALAERAARAWQVDPSVIQPPAPSPAQPVMRPPVEPRDVAAELWLAAHSANVSPRRLRLGLARILAAADAHGWTVAELRAAIVQPSVAPVD